MPNYREFAVKLAKESARILLRMQKNAKIVNDKGKGDFALNADIASENHIIHSIKKKFPTHAILTEETGDMRGDSEYLWIIDPLEGTLNYANKLPTWAVNIGLFKNGKPYLGVVYAPILGEMFIAEKGKGATLNGKKIHVSKQDNPLKALHAISNVRSQLSISPHVQRDLGCCGIEMSYVACGRFASRVKLHGSDPYGYGASSIIVLEAGGKITDSHGKPWTLHSDGAITSNGKIHNKILNLINNNA